MTIKTDAIVIKEQATGEQDKLVTLLTREIGVIRAFANGARNPKNKNVATTGLLCYSDFSIEKTQKGAYIVKDATAKETFFSLRKDIVSLSLAQYFAELAFEFSPREERADEFLSLILNCVYLVAEGKKDNNLIKAAAELRFLSLAGYMPSLVVCDSCGKYESETMKFSISTGKIFCDACETNEYVIPVSFAVIAAMRHICFSEPQKVFSFKLSKSSTEELCEVTEKYLKALSGKKYKTLEFYKMMT